MPGDFEQGLAEKEHYPGIFLRPELPLPSAFTPAPAL
jgi:hypothetical protein